MSMFGNAQDVLIEQEGRGLSAAVEAVVRRVVKEELEAEVEAIFREKVRRLIVDELSRMGITLKNGNLNIKGGGPF